MVNYILISSKLVRIGKEWEHSKRNLFWPLITPNNCFSRLTLWG